METLQPPTVNYWRLELASELTLGLLHQINNQMTGLLFHHEECEALIEESHPAAAAFKSLKPAIEQIIQRLERIRGLHLSRTDTGESYHDLSDLVENQLDLVKILIPKTAQVEFTRALGATRCVRLAEPNFRTVLLYLILWLRPALSSCGATLTLGIWDMEHLQAKELELATDCSPTSMALVLTVSRFPGSSLSDPAGGEELKDDAVSLAALEAARALVGEFKGEVRASGPSQTAGITSLLVLPGFDLDS